MSAHYMLFKKELMHNCYTSQGVSKPLLQYIDCSKISA